MVALALIAACTQPPDTIAFAPADAAATPQELFVVTQQRLPLEEMSFEESRPLAPRHAQVTVSIPPTHRLGTIEWNDGEPDTLTDFAVTDFTQFATGKSMIDAVNRMPGQRVSVCSWLQRDNIRGRLSFCTDGT